MMLANQPDLLKSLFLIDSHIIFLNHGSFGATPRPVFRKYQKYQKDLERQPVEFLGRQFPLLMAMCRQHLAKLLNADSNDLVFVPNVTTGINIVARSLNLTPSDEVLASNHEYGAMDRCWKYLSEIKGFRYINHSLGLPLTDIETLVDDFWQSVTPRTRVIFLSHITSPTAIQFPVKEICRRARELGILTVIDGAHAPGQVSVDLQEIGADFYTGNLHKWLCAPKGSAFLYARTSVQPLLHPLVVSWGWESDTPGSSQYIDEQEWTGTRDISAYLAVKDAIDFQARYRWDEIRQRTHLLAAETQRRISNLTGIPPLHQDQPFWFAQMAASPLPVECDIHFLKDALYDQYHIEIPLIRWNGMNLIRYSFQGYNDARDMDALCTALNDLLSRRKFR